MENILKPIKVFINHAQCVSGKFNDEKDMFV